MGNFFHSKVFKGTLVLTIFSFLGKALGAVFKIGLSYFLGSFGLGIYQLIFPLMVFFVVLSSEGFATALTVKTAENKFNNHPKSYFSISIIYTAILSLVSAVMICLFSNIIGKWQGENIPPFIYSVIAGGVVVISILSIFKAEIRGEERFNAYSFAEIIEDILKVIFGLLFAWFLSAKGIMFSVAGVVVGITLSSLCTIAYLLIARKKKKYASLPTVYERRNFLKMSCLMVGAELVVPAVHFVESAIVISLLARAGASSVMATELYGLSRGMVSAILNLPFFLLSAFEILLLPNLARAKTNGIYYKKTQIGLFLAIFVMVPFVLLFLLFSPQVVSIVYGSSLSANEMGIAINLLRLGSSGLVFSALTTILVVILNSNNNAGFTFLSLLIAGVVKILFLIVFVPKLSIYGVELSSVLFAMVACLCNLVFAVKKKAFMRPQMVLTTVLAWIVIFGCVFAVYKILIEVLGNTLLACIASFGVVGLVGILVLLVLCLVNKKKLIALFKRLLGLREGR